MNDSVNRCSTAKPVRAYAIIKAVLAICARIAGNPPVKQNASATHNAASVIGGSAVGFRSGHGRCNRPDVAVILAASQRLSVSVIIATIVAAAGAIFTSASINCSISPVDPASRPLRTRSKPRRNVALMVPPSVPSVSRAAMVASAAKPAIQSRIRPIGYHSRSDATGAAPLLGATLLLPGRPSRARCPSHQAGNATVTTKARQ